MRWLSRLTGAIDAIVRRSKLDSELDDELHVLLDIRRREDRRGRR